MRYDPPARYAHAQEATPALHGEQKDMLWSRFHGLPPGLRYLPLDDWPPRPAPMLTQPWQAGVTGWIVVFGAVIAEIAGGTMANQMSGAIAVPVLISPVVIAFGFAAVQWWQVRSSAAEPASWWHLGGIAAAALTWVLWPFGTHRIVWWSTGAVILVAALLARRSRIAAWAAIPAALAGCQLATYFPK